MADERPSKLSASWASNGWGSTSRALTPAEDRASARVVPAMPAPAMMTSASWSRMGGYGAWGAVVSRDCGDLDADGGFRAIVDPRWACRLVVMRPRCKHD